MARSAWISVAWVGAISLALGIGACSGGGGAGGNGGDAGQDSTTTSCTTDAQCAASVPPTTPASCATGKCNAVQGTCEYVAKDADGDGHAAANCKSTSGVPVQAGDDCNDHDPNLYPGHPEACTVSPDGGVLAGTLCAKGTIACQSDGTQSPCQKALACLPGQTCVTPATGNASCADCTPGATRCAPISTTVTGVQTCDGTGNWGNAVSCAPGTCLEQGDAGTPTAQCAGSCAPGATQCVAGNSLETCGQGGTWGAPSACPASETCVGALGGTCTGQCGPTQSECVNNGVVTCQVDGTWSPPAPCINQTCLGAGADAGVTSGSCQGQCVAGSGGCNMQQPLTCDGTGTWQKQGAACGSGTPVCLDGACVVCSPGATQCDGTTQMQTCGAAGTWDAPVACPGGCSSVTCNPPPPTGYNCTAQVPNLGGFPFTAAFKFSGTLPSTVSAGASVSLTGFQVQGTVSGSILDLAWQAFMTTSATASVSLVDVGSNDASGATLNALATPVSVGPFPVSAASPPFSFTVPASPETLGTWTAPGFTGTLAFTSGAVQLSITAGGYTVPVTCTPSPVVTFATTTVTAPCSVPSTCASGVCTGGQCQAPTCADGVQNGSETAIDCGGSVCGPCGVGLTCKVNSDCAAGACSGGVCQPPSCTDGIQDGTETAVDCGGGTCPPCAYGQTCYVGTDCVFPGICAFAAPPKPGICQGPSCSDGIKDGTETDVDCGGSCTPCAVGKNCNVGTDCTADVCTSGTCATPTCTDGVKNGNETGVDCGGGTCPTCAQGKACLVNGDCVYNTCTTGTCQGPSCTDGVKDGCETGIDCGHALGCTGFATCGLYPAGQGCDQNSDCASNACAIGWGSYCEALSCFDGMLDGTETAVDCGGSQCAPCPSGDACLVGTDCQSRGCNGTTHTCQ